LISALATIFLAGLSVVLLPRLLSNLAATSLERFSNRLPGTLTVGQIRVDGIRSLFLQELTWRDGDDLEVRLESVNIGLDPLALLFRGSPLSRVEAGRLHCRLGNPSAPFNGPSDAIDRLRGLLPAGGRTEESGEGSFRRIRRLPDVRFHEVTGAFHSRNLDIRISGGSAHLGPGDDAMDGTLRRFEARLDAATADGVARQLSATALVEGGHSLEQIEVRCSPAMPLGPGLGSAGGLAWKPGELAALDLRFRDERMPDLRIEAIRIRWDPEQAPDAESTSGANRLPVLLPVWVREFATRHPLREIEVSRPVVDIALGQVAGVANGESGEPEDPDPEPTPTGDADFQVRVQAVVRAAESRVLAGIDRLFRAAERMPARRIRILGATVRYLEPGETVPRPGQSLENVDTLLTLEPSTRRVDARIRFDAPDMAEGENEIRFTLDPSVRSIEGRATISRLGLRPYRAMLPGWMNAEGDTAIGPADVSLTLDGPGGQLELEGDASIRNAVFQVLALASVPFRVSSLTMAGKLRWNQGEARLDVLEGILGVDRIRIPFSLSGTSLDNGPRFRMEARLDRLKAQDMLDSLPPEMVPSMEGVQLGGTFAASLLIDVDTRNLASLNVDFKPDMTDVRTLSLGRGVNLELLRDQFIHRIEESDGKIVKRVIGEAAPGWIALEDVPTYLVTLLTTREDVNFFRHKGFSEVGIRRSLRVNLQKGGFVQGASTLSQQLVKNLFLSREKTIARKLQEAFITWQLERSLTKDKILELYLNVIEWGPNIWGLAEAANHYFGKRPSELGVLEAAWLVMIIPNPRRYHEHFEKGQVPLDFERRAKAMIRELETRKQIPEPLALGAQEQRIRFVTSHGVAAAPESQEPPDEEFGN
jgi:hypothetical protein